MNFGFGKQHSEETTSEKY